jgi:hypothetical protein
MTGHRPFSELRKRMAPERRVRNAEATKRMLASMALMSCGKRANARRKSWRVN